ncbi:saccharopine dehydrogenase [Actinoplanes oblitus]|uniref:Saccharopine dehydrogenase n=1 Tax=Actinoplanes oblitus TaxID=3040509 RepID=A0ABY8WRY4_9ACTN|nr:saccharopine dehydrogenase [Actinoplanes oblitus]WIN00601.1 saccharopine dehydrogenase [Actinoplanes oblitus]
MPEPAVIGVLGAGGAVGTVAVTCLLDGGGVRVRAGCRRPGPAPAGVRPAVVDATDPAAVRRFASGCRLVLDCTAPAYTLMAGVRAAVLGAGADYVSVMDDGRTPPPPAGRTVVLAAGVSPGLSGLLPRLLAEGLTGPLDFTGAYAGLGALTAGAAADYLLSLDAGYGMALAAWHGREVPRALRVDEDFQVPTVDRALTGYPYLTAELRRQALTLPLARASWFNAFDGPHVLAATTRRRGAGSPGADAIAELVRASRLDAAGRRPYQVLYGELTGHTADGRPVRRSVVIRGTDGSALTGVVAAEAVLAVLAGGARPGVRYASDIVDSRRLLTGLQHRLPDTVVRFTGDVPCSTTSTEQVEGVL